MSTFSLATWINNHAEKDFFFKMPRSRKSDKRICQCCTKQKDSLIDKSNGVVVLKMCSQCWNELKGYLEKKGFK